MTTHTHDIDFKKTFTVEKIAGSQVKITGEIPYAELAEERPAALKALGKNIEVDGFRKGHVPESVIIARVGEMAILNEMAERVLGHFYPHIIDAHELEVIGHPKVEITKLAPENPLAFTATVAILPDITLPDYRAIAKEKNAQKASLEVTDEEVEKQIESIMRSRMAYERLQSKAAANTEKTVTVEDAPELPTPESESAKTEEAFDPETAPLPELTDEYVQGLGQPGQFTSVEDFKAKIKEHLTIEKEQEVHTKHRADITDAIITASTMELPELLVDSELGQMWAQMQEDISRANLKVEDYLAHIKKTEQQLREEWKPAAEKRAKLQLVLNEIAKKEDLKPDVEALEDQVKALMEQYKDADPMRVRVYVASILQNEAVMKMLEEMQ